MYQLGNVNNTLDSFSSCSFEMYKMFPLLNFLNKYTNKQQCFSSQKVVGKIKKQSTQKTILKDFLDVIASPCRERGVQLLKAEKIYILCIHSILVSSSLSITSAKKLKV